MQSSKSTTYLQGGHGQPIPSCINTSICISVMSFEEVLSLSFWKGKERSYSDYRGREERKKDLQYIS